MLSLRPQITARAAGWNAFPVSARTTLASQRWMGGGAMDPFEGTRAGATSEEDNDL